MSIKSLIFHAATEAVINVQRFFKQEDSQVQPDYPPLSEEEQELHKMRRTVKSMSDRIELVKSTRTRLAHEVEHAKENGEDTSVSERLLTEVQKEIDQMTKQIELAGPVIDDMVKAVSELQRQQELTNILNVLRSKD